jgi:hypothetical protein
MNCNECLVEMETMSTSDISGSAVAVHSATCAECARVLQAITDADRLMMQERDESYFTTPPDEVARRAVLLGQRRRVFGGVSVLAAALAGFSVWYAIESLGRSTRERYSARDGVTESFEIRCLSNTNVRELISPYMRTPGSQLMSTQPPLRVYTVRTTQAEMAKVREVLQRFDTPANGNCQLPGGTSGRAVPADAAPARVPDMPPPPA